MRDYVRVINFIIINYCYYYLSRSCFVTVWRWDRVDYDACLCVCLCSVALSLHQAWQALELITHSRPRGGILGARHLPTVPML